ncbi:MAG TPA: UbiA family prenyltransferase [Pseudomonadales bacterium]|nr:UbiA family prenyltransferase [Pseudomonadales bacterium]
MLKTPICVDLDGTLLKTDTLHELLVRVLKQKPWLLFWLPVWLMQGKHVLKRELAARCQLNAAWLPYNQNFLARLRSEHAAGRQLILTTGAHYLVAQAVADYLGIFSAIYATDDRQNLTGVKKAAKLVEIFGEKTFSYAGNDAVDMPVWERSDEVWIVNASPRIAKMAAQKFSVNHQYDLKHGLTLKSLLKAVRLHQWAKNILVFIPLLASHKALEFSLLQNTLLAFLAFGCSASLSYVINDIGDLDADRQHRSKHKRPFACGELSIPNGLTLVLLLATCAIFLTSFLPLSFASALVAYLVITNLYSMRLKNFPVLDVAILAGLYTLRVVAGGLATGVEVSFWLLAFSGFIFLSLAIVKRVSELLTIEVSSNQPVQCRGYWTGDIPVLTGLGTASAMMAVLVLALYINSPNVMALYSSPRYLWVLCPVMALWLGRVWLITGRGDMHDDPVVFALRDRMSWLLFLLAGAFMVAGANI